MHRLDLSTHLKTQIGRIDCLDNSGELADLTGGQFGNGDGLKGSNLFNDLSFFFACRYGTPL